MKDIKKKWIIVTGVNGLLGSTIKTELLKNGFGVIGIGRRETLTKNNDSFKYFKCDVSNIRQIKKFYKDISSFNLLGLVNNAGIQGPIGCFMENEMSEWINSINSNLIGPVMMTQEFIKLKNKNAYIVNISGGGATKPMEYFSSYAAAKTALVRFTETLSIELEQFNTKTIAIAPGFLPSNFHTPILNESVNIPKKVSDQIKLKFNKPDKPEFASKLICDFILGRFDNLNGKLISAIFDKKIIKNVEEKSDVGMLRRIDNQFYFKGDK